MATEFGELAELLVGADGEQVGGHRERAWWCAGAGPFRVRDGQLIGSR
ncbi:hypothetical protein ABZ807_15145 [Micromonospora sp. NPDC047548]